jgi:hypothetical protein
MKDHFLVLDLVHSGFQEIVEIATHTHYPVVVVWIDVKEEALEMPTDHQMIP